MKNEEMKILNDATGAQESVYIIDGNAENGNSGVLYINEYESDGEEIEGAQVYMINGEASDNMPLFIDLDDELYAEEVMDSNSEDYGVSIIESDGISVVGESDSNILFVDEDDDFGFEESWSIENSSFNGNEVDVIVVDNEDVEVVGMLVDADDEVDVLVADEDVVEVVGLDDNVGDYVIPSDIDEMDCFEDNEFGIDDVFDL